MRKMKVSTLEGDKIITGTKRPDRITQDEHKNLAKVAWSIGIISFIIIMYILAAS